MKAILAVSVVITLFCDVISKDENSSCPSTICNCEEGPPGKGRVINCRDKGLSTIPRFETTNELFYELTFGNSYAYEDGCSQCNHISTIPANAFTGLRVQVIDMSKNALSYVSTRAFRGLEPDLLAVSLEGNRRISPPYTALSTLTNLRKLSLKRFNQRSITRENTRVDTLINLEELSLKDMSISYITSNAFVNRVPKLKRLQLEDLPLESFPEEGLKPLINLQALRAVYVRITTIPYEAFSSFRNLKELDLSHNHIATMEPGCFRGIERSLEYLGLHLNSLDERSVGALASAQWGSLRQLNLGYNSLKNIPTGLFFNMNKLHYLNLDSNGITQIERGTLQGLESLKFLDLSYNAISTIPINTFTHTPMLTELDLRGEATLLFNLSRGSVNGLERSLTKLTLTDTPMAEADMWRAVGALSNIEILELAKTRISQIPDFQFLGNKRLQYLLLEGNKISELTQRKLHGLMNSLKSLNMQNNSIRSIDHCVFESISSLQMLYLGKNPLHCDCKVRWLRNWISKKIQTDEFFKYMVDGKCKTPQNVAKKSLWEVPESVLSCPTERLSLSDTCEDLVGVAPTTHSPVQGDQPRPADKDKKPRLFQFKKIIETTNGIEVSWNIEDRSVISKYIVEYQNLGINSETITIDLSNSLTYYAITDLKPDSSYTLCLTAILTRPRLFHGKSQKTCLVVKTLP